VASSDIPQLQTLFDADWYIKAYPLAAESELEPLAHYLENGDPLDYQPNRLFAPDFYSLQRPDIPKGNGERLAHYVKEGEKKGLKPNPFFDPAFYRATYPDLQGLERPLLSHYAGYGGVEGRSPSALFDGDWYQKQSQDVGSSGLDSLSHYLEHGDAAGLSPHPLFDPEHYSSQHPDLPRSGGARLIHFLESGGHDGSQPHPLFDSVFYIAQSPNLRGSQINLLVHYLEQGERMGLLPAALFDPEYYRSRYDDLQSLESSFLVHYVRFGRKETRSPNALFDPVWYLEQQSQTLLEGEDALSHYLLRGDTQNAWPHPLFDPEYYSDQHPELPCEQGVRLRHYLEHGGYDGSDPHPLFCSEFYQEQEPCTQAPRQGLLLHYLSEGEAQGLKPNPLFDPAYYAAHSPEALHQPLPMLVHFARWGGFAGRAPCALFDARLYLARNPKLTSASPPVDPLTHYLKEGAKSGESPHPAFDVNWYREQYYQEVRDSRLEPLSHFVTLGGDLGFDPHPLFDSCWYSDAYASYLSNDEIPFLHYLDRGETMGCQPSPFFDLEYYKKTYAVNLTLGETLFGRFCRKAREQGQRPSPLFDECVRFFRTRELAEGRHRENPAAGFFSEDWAWLGCPNAEMALDLPQFKKPRVSIIIPVFGQRAYTRACLRSIAEAKTEASFEVIVVDDGSPEAEYRDFDQIPNLRVVRNEANLGFLHSCNRGAAQARGEELVFLNNDTLVTDEWLDALLETRLAFPKAGLIGSRLLFPNGRLQEAGSAVWSDASAFNYGSGGDPEEPAYRFARKTDYVSAASVLVARSLFENLGGFDEIYAPAFYEDTDLAFRVRDAGFDVVVQPASNVIHFGGASHGRDINQGLKRYQKSNQQTFHARWKETLQSHFEPETDREQAALQRGTRRALVLDSTLLTPDQDSGSLRMFNLIRVLSRLGYAVTFVPADLHNKKPYVDRLTRYGIHVVCQPHCTSVQAFLEKSGKDFDLCIVSRPDTAARWLSAVKLLCPHATVLYDMVDFHHLRRERELSLTGKSGLPASIKKDEIEAAKSAHGVIAVSDFDRDRLLEYVPEATAFVVSNIHEIEVEVATFAERSGVMFIGCFSHPPNTDAVVWFVEEVLPRIHAVIPDLVFHVIGRDAPGDVTELASEHVRIEGYLEDVQPFLAGCRLSVAPLRYGAGVKGKVNQSMAHGLPCVATPVAVEGMDAKWDSEILVAETAEGFAAHVISLYRDEAIWREIATQSIRNIERTFSMEVAEQKLREIENFYGLPRG
jgi:GT2 family glycosyltransferase/glycosyltransferase involved in cell wall biosynthesis